MSSRVAIRLAIILASLCLFLWLAGVLLLMHQLATGTTSYPYWRETVPDALVFFLATGVVVATRRPAHPIGWLFIAGGLISAVQLLFGEYAAATLLLGPERLPYGATAEWLSYLLQASFAFTLFFLLLLFPTGRLLSLRWRIVGWAGVWAASVGIASSLLMPGPLEPSSPFDNPFGVDAAILDPVGAIAAWLLTVAVLGALLSLAVRFVIAVLRYRLYEIDLLINRALVYGSLTVVLAGLYEGSIVLLQEAFRALIGQESGLAIVASTLVIAALFTPFRRRIQSFIDRRFYRRKYDATRTLESFSTKLRDETDLGTLADDLVGVVRETMQPEHLSLWLRFDPEHQAKSATLRRFGQNEKALSTAYSPEGMQRVS